MVQSSCKIYSEHYLQGMSIPPSFFVEVFVPAHPHVLHNAALDDPQCGKGQAGLQHHLLHHHAVLVVPVALIINMIIRDDRWFTNYLESHPVVWGWCWLVVNSTPEILIFFVTFAFDKIWIWFVYHKGKFMIVFNYLKSLDLISHILI